MNGFRHDIFHDSGEGDFLGSWSIGSPISKYKMIDDNCWSSCGFQSAKKSSASFKGYRGERQITVKIPRDESCSNAWIRESTLHGGGGRPGRWSRSPSIEIWTLSLQLRYSSAMRSTSSNIVEECVCKMISSGGFICIAFSTVRVMRYFFSAGC
jgi:hypothetical protein